MKALRARGRQGGGASWRRAWSIAAVIGVVLMANWTTAFAAQPAPSGNGRLSPIGRPTVAPATRPGTPPSHRLTHTPLVKDPAALAATKQRVSARKGGAVSARASGVGAASKDPGADAGAPSSLSFSGSSRALSSAQHTAVFGVATGLTAADEAGDETPSDATGAIGPNNYVEMVNSEIAIYRRDLTPSGPAVRTEIFAGIVGGCATDPQIEWDVTQQIWLYSLLVVPCAVGQTDSWLNVGWSKTSDPSDLVNGWCHFSIFPDGDHTKVFDYPKLGHNDGWLLVGGNMFTSAGAFSNTGLLTLQRPANPAACGPGPSGYIFNLSSISPNLWTPVPVDLKSPSANGYVVATNDVSATTSSQVYLLTVDANGLVGSNTATLNVRNYGAPGSAPQPAPLSAIDTLDGRLTQAVGLVDPSQNGIFQNDIAIWTQHTVSDQTFTDQAGSFVRWYELLAPVPSAPSGYPAQVGTIWGGSGSALFNAAVSPSLRGNEAVIHYNAIFPNGPSVTHVLVRSASRFSFTPLSIMTNFIALAASPRLDQDASCVPGPCRWGDYAGVSPDPVQSRTVWATAQILGPPPSPCNQPCAQWITGNLQLAPFYPTAGYNILTSFGGIYSFGSAQYYGNLVDHGYPGPAIGLGEMPLGDGYQILTTFGGIYSFGSAAGHYFGNLIDHGYAGRAVAIAMTPSGNGYAILTSNGAIYTFGDASYFGNLLDHGYPGPAVSMAYTPDGFGYTILTAFGGIYSFGNAVYYGNLIDHGYPGPAVSLSYTGSGEGYEILTSFGGMYSFGDARYFGNLVDHGYPGPAVALGNTP